MHFGEGFSDENTMKYGVPQVSVLGPALFTIYINGLFSLNCNAEIFEFADDTDIILEERRVGQNENEES